MCLRNNTQIHDCLLSSPEEPPSTGHSRAAWAVGAPCRQARHRGRERTTRAFSKDPLHSLQPNPAELSRAPPAWVRTQADTTSRGYSRRAGPQHVIRANRARTCSLGVALEGTVKSTDTCPEFAESWSQVLGLSKWMKILPHQRHQEASPAYCLSGKINFCGK